MKHSQTAAHTFSTLFLLLLLLLILLLLSFALGVENIRTAEIETQCSSYLSSATDLVPYIDATRSITLKNELSFSGGDWEQLPGSSHLMPFDDTDSWQWFPPGPEKLADFDIIDVNPIQHVPNAVTLTGSLTIGIYRNRSLDHDIGFEPGFSKKPGFSTLVITFEGVYVENRGEKVLCLLGNSRMPSTTEPSYLDNNYLSIYGSQSEGTVDNQVLLVLRYPRSFNLTSRAIKGEMRSFDEPGSSRYFDRVHITSQLRNYTDYSFSETVGSRVCNDSLFRDEMIENDAIRFNASNACMILHEIRSVRFGVEPNVDPKTNRLGPFVLDKEKKDPNQQHREDFILIFQSIRCEVKNGSVDTARVSAIVRAMSTKTDQVTASFRTGISGATMSIEGSWNDGLFCGIGCFEDRCDTQISFYFPRSLSVRQRNIVSGTISSIGNQSVADYFPLKFTFFERPSSLMDYTMPCRFNYSKIDSARELWERRNKEFDFTTKIEKSILRYPSLEDGYNRLSKHLSFRSYVIAICPHYAGRFIVQVEVLSMGPFCGNFGDISGSDDITDSRLVNVSIHLRFIDEPHWHFHANYEVVTDMFYEGVYDISLGEMHLLGCAGPDTYMDCLIEARLKYSPSNTRWLKHPLVYINVTSQRNITDPLRFNPIEQISYVFGSDDRVEKHLLIRVIFEGTLRILVISLDITIVLSQFAHMNKKTDSIPRISLVMIGIQILGYVVPFIGVGPEIAVPSKMSKSFNNYPQPRFLFDIIEHSTRFLLLVVISVMLMFIKRVKESRTRESTESENITNDKKILVLTSVFHMIGFAIFAAPKFQNRFEIGFASWPRLLKKYFYIIQWFFMVPQVIATYVSKSSSATPAIRTIYMFWFVFSRLLLDFYDKFRDYVPHPTSWEMKDVMEMVDHRLMAVQYKGDTNLTAVLIVGVAIVYVHALARKIIRQSPRIEPKMCAWSLFYITLLGMFMFFIKRNVI